MINLKLMAMIILIGMFLLNMFKEKNIVLKKKKIYN
jgi:hypothetical protein